MNGGLSFPHLFASMKKEEGRIFLEMGNNAFMGSFSNKFIKKIAFSSKIFVRGLSLHARG
jgi:hypothetical protein